MHGSKQRLFIALLPPLEVQADVTQIKQIFADRYNSRAALRSPPHITLVPPFEWQSEAMPALARSLAEFAVQMAPLAIALEGFGAFVPRVVYVNVVKTPELLRLQACLASHMATHGIGDRNAARPFAPHLTVGFRDLTKQNFWAAWSEFQTQSLAVQFTVAALTLLQHDGQRWNVYQEFPFCPGS